MKQLHLFTDASVNNQLKVGVGAYLLVENLNLSIDELRGWIQLRRFDDTSSTKLELQTLLWAINELISTENNCDFSLTIYTDSQNIITLPKRQVRLEQSQFISKNGKRLKNYLLYQEFYKLVATLQCKLVKVDGHKRPSEKNTIDKIFSLVDRASRKAQRD